MKPTLAHDYKGQDVTGWLASEKLDGVRALWDGDDLRSRNGNVFNAPEWFKSQLPPCRLDGELYIGAGQFQRTPGIVRKKTPVDAEWREIKYAVFDAPWNGKFADRYRELNGIFEATSYKNSPCFVVPHFRVTDQEHLMQVFDAIVGNGGEGLMIRNPDMQYEQGRTHNLLKLKSQDSSEASVIGHEPGQGKHLGRLGALICNMGGKTFNVGTGISDADRENPPPIGSIITVNFNGLTDGGIPRFPVFAAVRNYE